MHIPIDLLVFAVFCVSVFFFISFLVRSTADTYSPPAGCVVYEDGSARCSEGTFKWDCSTMGNNVCGNK